MSPPLAVLLIGLGVDGFQQLLHVHAVYGAGLRHGFTPAAGTAQAVHTDGQENRRGLGRHVQDVANDGI